MDHSPEQPETVRENSEAPASGGVWWFVRIVSGALGVFWCLAGVSKLLDWFVNLSPWAFSERLPVWTDQFGPVALIGVSLAELLLGVWMLLRPTRLPAALGLGMLAVFTAALLLRPPSGTPCGCLGVLAPIIDFETGDPHVRNVVLALGHAMVLVFAESTRSARSRQRNPA